MKQKILKVLEGTDGFVSGEQLSRMLGVSRTAVWKNINALREEGYKIASVTNRGYRLTEKPDLLDAEKIARGLGTSLIGKKIEVMKIVDSTNDEVKRRARNGEPSGLVIAAEKQTGGKGRLGRSFFSPKDSGLYLSILLRPKLEVSRAVRITTCAALAVCDAIESATGEKPDIKWVNDVYLRGRKVCGILTEASVSMENGGLDYAVLGIGINVYEPPEGFPEELKNIAGAVAKRRTADLKNKLAATVVTSFMRYYANIAQGGFREDYSKRLMWKGEQIVAVSGENKTPCRIIDVDEECRLEVELENGEHKLISSGEISIRKAK